jgi:glycosyltransferase involved in cell wall biosynthesis
MTWSSPISAAAGDATKQARTLLVSLGFPEAQANEHIGLEAYSYHFVYRAFAPLLERWGKTRTLTQAESRLDYAIWQARREQHEPLHLSFLPLHLMYLTGRAPNLAFPFWEFPDIPQEDFDNNPRNNWARLANRLTLILTASSFTRDALVRGGVTTPVCVVPVPIGTAYFGVPSWQPGQRVVLDCPCYVFPPSEIPAEADFDPWVPVDPRQLSWRAWLKHVYMSYFKPRLPRRMVLMVTAATRTARSVRKNYLEEVQVSAPTSGQLELSDVVYTTFLNPFDPRKNWQDVVSAYLRALGDRPDATLVVKLVINPRLEAAGLNSIMAYYRGLGLRHRCKLVFVSAYLSESQMVELARASTYYVNAARAEGACLPLQDFLAAGRPGVAPVHTALAEYFNNDVGFVVASHPEPACWPHDPAKRFTTSWHRIVWQSLHDQFRASYETACKQPARYQSLADAGRQRMQDFGSIERVWPLLETALNQAWEGCSKVPHPANCKVSAA